MPSTYIRRAAVALTLLAMAGCTVKSSDTPPLTGPSGLALSLTVNAIPDSINQDGGSQSSLKILAIGPNGKPQAGVPLRLDMAVGGVSQDYGTLSARSVVTNGDGVATAVYTAPPSLAGGVACSGLPGNCVAIIATPTSTNFSTANPEQVLIRLVPTGVVLPPAGTPTAAFAVSPQPVQMNVVATFDASASKPGTGASAITSYAWTFGDGSSGTGLTVNHTFTSQQNFNVTLTVTNDRGLSASTTSVVGVGSVVAPNPTFVFSPASPQIGQAIVFNGDQSTAAPGHTLTAFAWNFGDGATDSGSISSHAYSQGGAYNVVLTVTDDTGQKVAKSLTVTVVNAGSGSGTGSTVAAFVASPSAPVVGQVVFFNASSSSAATGHSLTKYAWDFGDGTAFSGAAATTNHTFTTPGSYTVALVVTDDTGTTAKAANTVTVAAAGAAAPIAAFTSSPSNPGVNQSVFFNASTSTPGAGHTISTYAWDYGDGSTGSGITPSHPYTRAGQFTVNLVVTDEAGQTGAKSATITVSGVNNSQIVASFTFSPTNPAANNTVFFDSTGSSTSGGATITTYAWDFGDGTTCGNAALLTACGVAANTGGTNAKPTHPYTSAHTWVVRLTVTDNSNNTATTQNNVTVQ